MKLALVITLIFCFSLGAQIPAVNSLGPVPVNSGGTGVQTCASNAILKGAVTSALICSGVTIDGSNNLSTPGSYSSGVGSGATGFLSLATGTVPANPAAGLQSIFLNSANSNHASRVDSAGVVVDIEAGSGGGGANTALSNLAAVAINTALLPVTSIDLGSTTKPFRDLYIYGSQTFGTNYEKLSMVGEFLTIGDDTPTTDLKIGGYPGATTTFAGLWSGGVTPSSSNFLMAWALNNSATYLNSGSGGTLHFQINNTDVMNIVSAAVNVGSTFTLNPSTGIITKYFNNATVGVGLVPVYGRISSTGLTAAVSTATLCAAAVCTVGQYEIQAYLDSTVVCATPGIASVGLNITWTDETGTHSAQAMPLDSNSALTLAATMPLGDATTYAFGRMYIYTSGANAIQYSTSYTGCTSGTGTHTLRITAAQLG